MLEQFKTRREIAREEEAKRTPPGMELLCSIGEREGEENDTVCMASPSGDHTTGKKMTLSDQQSSAASSMWGTTSPENIDRDGKSLSHFVGIAGESSSRVLVPNLNGPATWQNRPAGRHNSGSFESLTTTTLATPSDSTEIQMGLDRFKLGNALNHGSGNADADHAGYNIDHLATGEPKVGSLDSIDSSLLSGDGYDQTTARAVTIDSIPSRGSGEEEAKNEFVLSGVNVTADALQRLSLGAEFDSNRRNGQASSGSIASREVNVDKDTVLQFLSNI